ncbi:MAG: ABC transporter permease subunit [Chloroflexota bacterium]
MRNIWTIAKREFNNYFSSPVAYTVAFLVLAIIGLIFVLNILSFSNNPYGGSQAPDSRLVTGPMAFMLMLAIPALTMRLLADELRMGTMELLMTAPIRDYELVTGKWLGAFLFILVLIGISLIFPLMLNQMVKPGIDQMQMVSGYLGVILAASALLGLGVGISALFSNQIAAFFTTMVLFIVLWWLIGAPASILPTGGEIFSYLDMSSQVYNSFNEGVIKLSSIIYFLSLTGLGLFIGSTAVETRRWR